MPGERKPFLERLLKHISPEPNTGCWLWSGSANNYGYGIIGKGERKDGTMLAHRATYEIYKGKVPFGLDLDHLCRVRICCNPDHLEPVTRKENCRRGLCGQETGLQNRSKTHCPKGHPYDSENTYYYKDGMARGCQLCRKESSTRSYLKSTRRAAVTQPRKHLGSPSFQDSQPKQA